MSPMRQATTEKVIPDPGTKQPCHACAAETKNKKACPACGAPVTWMPPKKIEREKPIRERVQALLIREGCLVKTHTIDNRHTQASGLGVGTSDLICIVPPYGRFMAIEMKRPKYSPSDVTPAQRAFLVAVRHFGGVSGIATCESEALALLAEARRHSPDAPLPESQ